MFKTQPVLMTVSLCCGLALPATAQLPGLTQQEALRGLEAVYVLLDNPIGGWPGRPVMDSERLRTVIELALRTAGILVQSEEDIQAKRMQNPKYREAYLYVGISTGGLFPPGFYTLLVQLREVVKLIDDSGLVFGAIWTGSRMDRFSDYDENP